MRLFKGLPAVSVLKWSTFLIAIVFAFLIVNASVRWITVRVRTSETATCIDHLRSIDAAKQQWFLEGGRQPPDPLRDEVVTSNSIPTWEILSIYGGVEWTGGQGWRPYKCPAGGVYTLGRVADLPTCSITNHFLSWK
jgi:hypothetical protein